MTNEIVDIADLDCIYLSYDEPKKEETWIKIQNMVPWAQRVDGVKGSDAAHKAAADASSTDRFVLIDGDNLPYPEFFESELELTSANNQCVFRWKARNSINGLMYGNGQVIGVGIVPSGIDTAGIIKDVISGLMAFTDL